MEPKCELCRESPCGPLEIAGHTSFLTSRLTRRIPQVGVYAVYRRMPPEETGIWRIGVAYGEKEGLGGRLEEHRDHLNTWLFPKEVSQYYGAWSIIMALQGRRTLAENVERELLSGYLEIYQEVPRGNQYDRRKEWVSPGCFCPMCQTELHGLLHRFVDMGKTVGGDEPGQ